MRLGRLSGGVVAFAASALALAALGPGCGGSGVTISDLFGEAGTGGDGGLGGDGPDLGVDGGGVDADSPCVGPSCPAVCPPGSETTLTGKVFAPNGKTPLYNTIVYAPRSPLAPITHGPTCERCGTVSGDPIATALTDATGKFELKNIPDGKDVRIVIQSGKWRREIKVPEVKPCQSNEINDANLTRLPKTQAEGDMPRIALTTGQCDNFGCMLPKIGIAPTEFGVAADGATKAVHSYGTNGTAPAGASTADSLWSDATKLGAYDLVLLSCECSENLTNKGGAAGAPFGIMTDYVKSGGRIFTTDFQYVWYRYSTDPGMQSAFEGRWNAPIGGPNLRIDTGFPKGAALGDWLQKSAGLASGTTVTPSVTFGNLISNDPNKSQRWATDSTQVETRAVSVNLPTGLAAGQHCGKALHIDAHINQTETVGPSFPNGCGPSLLEGENLLAFMLFDLGSCIQDDTVAPVPPKTTK